MVAPNRWPQQGLCVGDDPEKWFPVHGKDPNLAASRMICAACPVKLQCLEFALETQSDDGVFGGLSGAERVRLRSERGIKKPRQVRDVKPHGTMAAVARHERAKEKLCDLCRPVKTANDNERKKRRRAAVRAARDAA